MSFIASQRVSVIGAGISGLAAARYLVEQRSRVFLSDGGSIAKLKATLKEAELLGQLDYEGDGHTEKVFEADLLVVSPGVPQNSWVITEAKNREIPIIGELELGYQASMASFVAITGSTGKSTTVSLMHHIFVQANKEQGLCGNIGEPVVAVAPALSSRGVALCEVSSFQLETIETFAPEVAILLNLAPNHLDRHSSLDEYYAMKFRIVENMKSGLVIVNGADTVLVDWATNTSFAPKVKVLFFGEEVVGYDSAIIKNGSVIIASKNYASIQSLELPGEHNKQNACVAGVVAHYYHISSDDFEKALGTFNGLAHRMEKVAEKSGVTYYNDSKATTAESVEAALSGFADGTVHLIAGGRDKGSPFEDLTDMVGRKCKEVYAIGEAQKRLEKCWSGASKVTMHATLEAALARAFAHAQFGDVVLLSPGCSSFDMFENFIDRGTHFKKAVQEVLR